MGLDGFGVCQWSLEILELEGDIGGGGVGLGPRGVDGGKHLLRCRLGVQGLDAEVSNILPADASSCLLVLREDAFAGRRVVAQAAGADDGVVCVGVVLEEKVLCLGLLSKELLHGTICGFGKGILGITRANARDENHAGNSDNTSVLNHVHVAHIVNLLAVLISSEGADSSVTPVEGAAHVGCLEGISDNGSNASHGIELLLGILRAHKRHNLDPHPRQLLADFLADTLAAPKHSDLTPLSLQVLKVAPPNRRQRVARVKVLHPDPGETHAGPNKDTLVGSHRGGGMGPEAHEGGGRGEGLCRR
mmetsp:Transcript_3533/g.7078  ORF Transcript_3533/g.7078 Transcript_3533/m.7078 type:complete len:304 (+) Transcript_3533:273-1184(+)